MSNAGSFPVEPIPIGEIAAPPFVRLPEPMSLFARRAARFRTLTQDHALASYLLFLAAISERQHALLQELPQPAMPSVEALKQARDFGMPPLNRSQLAADPALEAALERLFALLCDLEMPDVARAGLEQASKAQGGGRAAMVHAVLDGSYPAEDFAAHIFIAAALQVDLARRASRLEPDLLRPIGIAGICPSCGAPPVASQIVAWEGAHGVRFCVCSLCATLWHAVRITCTACGSTEGIAYEEIEGSNNGVKAETCARCRSYVKILHQDKYPDLDPVADDVASLGLDLLLRESGYRRAAMNPFLLGY